MRSLCLTALILCALTACSVTDDGDVMNGSPVPGQTGDSADKRAGSEVQMNILSRGSYGRMAENVDAPGRRAPFVEVAGDQAELEALWAQYVAAGGSPTVSFDGTIVVFLLMPPQPTGGYGIEPETVAMSGSTVEVHAKLRQPGAGAITTQAFTAPFAVIEVTGAGAVERVEWINQGRLLASAKLAE